MLKKTACWYTENRFYRKLFFICSALNVNPELSLSLSTGREGWEISMNIPENGSLFLYQSYFRVTEQLLRICSENITTSDHTSNPTSILSNQGDLPFDITNTYCQVDHHQNETTKLSKVTFKKEVHIKQITDTHRPQRR